MEYCASCHKRITRKEDGRDVTATEQATLQMRVHHDCSKRPHNHGGDGWAPEEAASDDDIEPLLVPAPPAPLEEAVISTAASDPFSTEVVVKVQLTGWQRFLRCRWATGYVVRAVDDCVLRMRTRINVCTCIYGVCVCMYVCMY